jgi:hypothetical protein
MRECPFLMSFRVAIQLSRYEQECFDLVLVLGLVGHRAQLERHASPLVAPDRNGVAAGAHEAPDVEIVVACCSK